MGDEINGIKVPFIPLVQTENEFRGRINSKQNDDFSSIFNRELEKIKFSSHAVKRLEARNIQLDESSMTKLNDAVDMAEAKGAKDSLIMIDQTAFIINVPNRTVVTALELSEKEDKVFTNIDSVVFT